METLFNTSAEAALAAAAAIPDPAVETIRYAPGNCALLIGPAERLLGWLEAVRVAGLRPALLSTGAGDAARLPAGLRALAGQPAAISGWMGSFTASLRTAGEPASLAPLSFHADGHFDWVLDFTTAPAGDAAISPPGYYRLPADDFTVFKGALMEIARHLRDGFRKPRYFRFDASLCAHERQGFTGCNACVVACPAHAISIGKGSVSIEPHLCRGCGTCATVCPSSAVRYNFPDTQVQLDRLAAALLAWQQVGGDLPGLWIGAEKAPPGWLAWPIDAVASLGLEFWLLALCLGCTRIAVSIEREREASRVALEQQLSMGRSLLAGLGYPPVLGCADDGNGLPQLRELTPLPPKAIPAGDDKRTLLFAALDHLVAHGSAVSVAVDLTDVAAPLGEVSLDKSRCTLCGTCVNVCPSGALTFSAADRIAFVESRCLQCGLCASVCPEQAVALHPRLLTSRSERETPRQVAEAEMFLCADCGDAFAPRAMVERSRIMMAGHPMFEGDKARLMDLCPGCRQRAVALF